MSPPKRLPKFFIDRSLGRVAVPAGLREDGWDVVTLAEHYGMPRDEEVADTEWIADAASRGWPILMKDKRIRHRSAEIEAVTTKLYPKRLWTKSPWGSGLSASRSSLAFLAV